MPRVARSAPPGLPGHFTQRGSGRQEVSVFEAEYGVHLELPRESASRSRREGDRKQVTVPDYPRIIRII